MRTGLAIALATTTLALAGAATPVLGEDESLPARRLSGPLVVDGRPTSALMGALWFSSPELLGEDARARGLSCQSCHPNGGARASLVVEGASPLPGLVDLSSGHLGSVDDGVPNAVVVPTLRGVLGRARFGAAGTHADLAGYLAHHIVDELGGDEPPRARITALVAFLALFDHAEHPLLDANLRLVASASAAARRGEALFATPERALGGMSCASCHAPLGGFADGRLWTTGQGPLPARRTPSLLDLGERARFFSDGRAASMRDAILDYERRFALKRSSTDRDALVAYLEAVGGAPATDARSLESALRERVLLLRLVALGDDAVCALALRRVDEALSARVPPARVAFKVEGARARVRGLEKSCGASSTSALTGEIDRLSDDLSRLAGEWQDALARDAERGAPDAVR